MKKLVSLVLISMLIICLALTGCQAPADSTEGAEAPADSAEASSDDAAEAPSEAAAESEDDSSADSADSAAASAGGPVTPDTLFPYMAGLDNPGAIAKDSYHIAFSVGNMGNAWTRAMLDDMLMVAEAYEENFGVTFEFVSADANTTKQLSDVQSLISKKPDLLIVSPNEPDPLTPIVDWCTEAEVPLITIIENLSVEPGEGMYIMNISLDNFLNGIGQGIAIVDKLTEEYGEPKGNVIEIAGILGASSSIQRSMGVHWVLKDYPDIKIPVVREGEWNPDTTYQVMQDVLSVMEPGTIDAIFTSADDSTLGCIEAVKAAGREDELHGKYFSINGNVSIIEKILDGTVVQTTEGTPLFGYFAFEYAVQYLNGDAGNVPKHVVIPQRNFIADTPERKEALQELYDYCVENEYQFVPLDTGYWELFDPLTEEQWGTIYERDGYFLDPKYGSFEEPYSVKE